MATPRLKQKFREEIIPALMKRFNYRSPMQVPRLEKVVINMGVGEAVQNPKVLDGAMQDLALITGQKPAVTGPRSPSPVSNCGQGCRSAAKSPCAATGCTISSTS